jgi:tRNA pseudouridine55 synthase
MTPPPATLCEAGFVLNARKPEMWTSHDAVRRMRRVLHFRRIGHTGTLDPFAGGVLVCCVGRATKLAGYLMELTKEYAGTMLFGRRTNSGDIAGEVIEERQPIMPSLAELAEGARRFEGEILQVPPMVSALKHEGVRLYRLARQGITVERKPRPVFVEVFEIQSVDGARVRFRVRCARGTYVRTLVEDLGAQFGLPACVAELCRTRVGRFCIEDALDLEGDLQPDDIFARAIPMGEALDHLPVWSMPPFWVRKLRDGQAPPWVVLEMGRPPEPGEVGRLLAASGELVALGRAVPTEGRADRPWYDALGLEVLRVI